MSTARARAAATSTAEPGIGRGAGIGTTIAERQHLSRTRPESLNTEVAHNRQQQGQQQEQQHYYRQQVQLQPPSLFDAESLSRLEVPLQRETNNTDRSQNSSEEFSPKTPVPDNVAVECDQDVERESDTLPRQEQANGSHGHRQVRGDFLDHYIDLLSYLKDRKERTREFKKNLARQKLSPEEASLASHAHFSHERMCLRQRRTRTTAVQFQILTQVGQGGFGEVFLARKSDTAELCALKRMSKRHLHLQDEVQHILTERDVLTATRSEWHVRLLYAFQDPDYVYLAMEFVPGGDVRTMLSARGVLREEDTWLYFAEMVMAIDALHAQGYIHRDLKPENFLIDATGHIKLTDFGLSKGQLAESRIAEMKRRLETVKGSMEPAGPTLRRSGGSTMMMMNHGSRLYGSGMLGEMSARSTKLGAGGSIANLNGILHRSPSHLLWTGSSANFGGGTSGGGCGGMIGNNSLLNLPQEQRHMATTQQQPQQPETVPEQEHEYRNEGIRRAFSIVGSADYMAPEILASLGYDYGVDYWSLGCILFEFLAGYSPFQGEDTHQTCVNVWHWRQVLRRPMYDTEENLEFNLTDEAWDLITRLITDREDRYTTLDQVKQHPWLAGLDWDNLRSIEASFVPVLQTPMDTSYFDDFSNPADMAGYKDVMLRQAQVHDAEIAASAASSDVVGGTNNYSSGSLPYLLRVQDPWKGAFVGFTFRHQRK
ncbi:hypothetical protein BG006_002740 [Podila minutissima]|uniref:non-specific serine/threonine protein kinase n=1 Tax=Podila minutissima TaxID=64525 RepID=A0A9P5SMR6_9FUNG|nr:hypothetical protein BG006_002740 [Podila minutissima]